MISIEKCKKILLPEQPSITTAEVEAIRENLYALAKLSIDSFSSKIQGECSNNPVRGIDITDVRREN